MKFSVYLNRHVFVMLDFRKYNEILGMFLFDYKFRLATFIVFTDVFNFRQVCVLSFLGKLN